MFTLYSWGQTTSKKTSFRLIPILICMEFTVFWSGSLFDSGYEEKKQISRCYTPWVSSYSELLVNGSCSVGTRRSGQELFTEAKMEEYLVLQEV